LPQVLEYAGELGVVKCILISAVDIPSIPIQTEAALLKNVPEPRGQTHPWALNEWLSISGASSIQPWVSPSKLNPRLYIGIPLGWL
jgi:hypothetical protein